MSLAAVSLVPVRRFRTDRLLLLLFTLTGLVAIAKGLPRDLIEESAVYWVFSYRYGFIRRALIGTIFHPAYAFASYEQLKPAILAIHAAACVAIVCSVAALFWRAASRETRLDVRLTLAFALLSVMCSQLMPVLAHDAGSADVYIVLGVLAGFWFVLTERYLAAMLTSMVGPFIHEAFIFVWSPVGIALVWSAISSTRDRSKKLLAVLAPVAAAVILVTFHDAEAEQQAVAALPISTQMQLGLAAHTFGQTLVSAFAHMRSQEFPNNVGKVSEVAAFFLVPAVATLWAAVFCYAARWAAPARTFAVMIAMTLCPLTILAMAWDLARFLVWSNLAAAISLIAAGTPGLLAHSEART